MTEETVNEEKEVKGAGAVAPVVMDPATLRLFTDLQAKVDKLETKSEASLLAELLDKVGGRSNEPETGQFNFNKKYKMSDIDEDDVLAPEDQVTFIAHKWFHFICDDNRAGMDVPAPLGTIRFKYDSTAAIRGGRETELIQKCVYTCRSKKELEWLRAHSKFQVVFFDKVKGIAFSQNIEKSKALAKQMIALNSMGQHDLILSAKARGINPGGMDLGDLRASIATSVVDEQFKNSSRHTENLLLEEHLEATKMGRAGTA